MSGAAIEALQHHPTLANILSGVRGNQNLIGEQVLQPVDVQSEWFEYEKYDNGLLEDPGTEARAMFGSTPEIGGQSASTADAKLQEFARFVKTDYREVAAAAARDSIQKPVAGMSNVERLRLSRALRVQKQLELLKEKAIASVVFTDTNYDADLRITTAAFGTVDLLDLFYGHNETVRTRWGVACDTLTIGTLGWQAVLRNADLMSRIVGGATTANPAEITPQLVASILGLKQIRIGQAVTQIAAAAGTYGTATRLWTADTATLTYSGVSSIDEKGDSVFEDELGIDPVFARLFFMNVPETGVRYDVRTYDLHNNGKVEALEGTEFHKALAIAPVGVHFANVDQ